LQIYRDLQHKNKKVADIILTDCSGKGAAYGSKEIDKPERDRPIRSFGGMFGSPHSKYIYCNRVLIKRVSLKVRAESIMLEATGGKETLGSIIDWLKKQNQESSVTTDTNPME
jgi:hypothetical protein